MTATVGVAERAPGAEASPAEGGAGEEGVHPAPPGRRVSFSWTVLALLGTLVIVTIPFWEVLQGKWTTVSFDVNDYYAPAGQGVWRLLRAGHTPWWTPNVYAGSSTLGVGQYGVFYPFNALYGYLDAATAHRWWMLSHLWLAATGMFCWSAWRWQSRFAGVVSGCAYALSGFYILHLQFNPFIATATWLPWVFLGIDLVRDRWTTPRATLVAVPLALLACAGHPQMLFYAGIGVGTYLAVPLLARRPDLRGCARGAGACALGLALAAMQLLPLWRYGHISIRSHFDQQQAFDRSASLRHLLSYPFPFLYGGSGRDVFNAPWTGGSQQMEVGLFAGVTVLALAGCALVARRRERTVVALGAVALAGTLVMLGPNTPAGSFIYRVVPMAASFRAWSRAALLPTLALAMLAGGGVQYALKNARKVQPWFAAWAATLALAALALPRAASLHPYLSTGALSIAARAVPVGAAFAFVAAFGLLDHYRRAGTVAVAAVCTFELVFFATLGPWHAWSMDATTARVALDTHTEGPFGAPLDAPDGIDRWFASGYGYRMMSLTKNYYGINAFDPLAPKDFTDSIGGMTYDGFVTSDQFWRDTWLADILRVTTMILDTNFVPQSPQWRLTGKLPDRHERVWNRTPRLPDAYLMHDVRVESLADIRSHILDKNDDLTAHAYIEKPVDGMESGTNRGFTGRVTSNDVLGSGRVTVEADAPSLLVLSHAYQQGWKATVDGRSAPVRRVNALVLGVPVPAGHHDVKVWFEPPGLRPGIGLAAVAGFTLFIVSPAWMFWRRRHPALVEAPETPDSVAGSD
ncbi:MAG TPA: YfhO family protein [Acidimicrobiia bacterium]|nr:YfhO family protein [Acidimicrobiia bacterium]